MLWQIHLQPRPAHGSTCSNSALLLHVTAFDVSKTFFARSFLRSHLSMSQSRKSIILFYRTDLHYTTLQKTVPKMNAKREKERKKGGVCALVAAHLWQTDKHLCAPRAWRTARHPVCVHEWESELGPPRWCTSSRLIWETACDYARVCALSFTLYRYESLSDWWGARLMNERKEENLSLFLHTFRLFFF